MDTPPEDYELADELWQEELARRRARVEWTIFWIVMAVALIGAGYLIIKKEQAAQAANNITLNATTAASSTPEPATATTDVFPNPMSPSANSANALNLDSNLDGQVDEDEARSGHRIFDKNANGRLDPEESAIARATLKYTNEKVLETVMDTNEDGKVSVGERWQHLKSYDTNRDGDLSDRELRVFWQNFVKKAYAGQSWALLIGDSPEPLEAVRKYIKANSKNGIFALEGLELELVDGKSLVVNPVTSVVEASFELKKGGNARVDFFVVKERHRWEVVDSWFREPLFRCPKHQAVVSPTPRKCPFDQVPLERMAPAANSANR